MQIRPAAECGAAEGALLGAMLVHESRRAKTLPVLISTFVSRTAMFSECLFPHLDAMLTALMERNTRLICPVDVATTEPWAITKEQATQMGMSIHLLWSVGHTKPAVATRQALNKYPSLGSLAEQHAWFAPMLEAIARAQLAWTLGAKLRLTLSTVLSLFDVGSDLSSVINAFLGGQADLACGILATVALSVAIQTLVVVIRNVHRGWWTVCKEVLICFSFFKPVVDLLRQLHGEEAEGAPFDVTAERAACKVIETTCESLPCAIILLIHVLRTCQFSWVLCLSIFLSWLATAQKTADIAFTLDTDSERRRTNPTSYGYVPEGTWRRRAVYVELFLMALMHVMMRTVSSALLYVVSPAWLGGFLGVDMGLGLLYKAIRHDWHCWVPGVSALASTVYRVLIKVMTDFTGLPHFRHAYDLGGAYWAATMAQTPLLTIVAAGLYCKYFDGPSKLSCPELLAAVGVLVVVWAAILIAFALTIDRAYLRSFVSLQTAEEHTRQLFKERAGNDELRVGIFRTNHRLWEHIYEDVGAWVEVSYESWKQQRPAWLTDSLIASIPDDLLQRGVDHAADRDARRGQL